MMHSGTSVPVVKADKLMREAIFEITSKGLGCTGVIDAEGALIGVITDGDLRRALEKGTDFLDHPASELMIRNPKRILSNELAAKGLQRMEQYSITSLFVFEDESSSIPVGILHLHDLLKAGLA
jgi:arabinose-5-phosphate isomerase